MVWYLINMSILFIFGLTDKLNITLSPKEKNRNYKILFVIETIFWVIISGLRRWDIGEDTSTYAFMFEREKSVSWSSIWIDFVKKYFLHTSGIVDPGYRFLVKTLQLFIQNYQFFLVVIAIVFFISLAVFLYNNSHIPSLSYILFGSLFYSFYALTGLRQTLASAIIVLLGTELIRKRKLILFLIVAAVAATIHLSVLCFVPFYWLSQIKITKRTLGIYWILITLSYVFKDQFLRVLQYIIGYEQYNYYESKSSPYVFLGLLFIVSVFSTLFYKKITTKKSTEQSQINKVESVLENEIGRIAMNALFIACIFSSLVLINPSCMRVVHYYAFYLMLLLPEFTNVFNQKSKKAFVLICFIILLFLFVRKGAVYYFFWE